MESNVRWKSWSGTTRVKQPSAGTTGVKQPSACTTGVKQPSAGTTGVKKTSPLHTTSQILLFLTLSTNSNF
jgi:hypothetical protein